MNLVSLLFSFRGRISRAQYWSGNTAAGGIGFLAFLIIALILAPPSGVKTDLGVQMAKSFALLAPLVAALVWAGLALQVKRFHDRGRSGYFVLAPFIPLAAVLMTLINGVVTDAPAQTFVPATLNWAGLLSLINLFLFIDLGCLPGQNGPNKYGDPPGTPLNAPAPPALDPTGPRGAAPASLGNAEKMMELAIANGARAAPRALRKTDSATPYRASSPAPNQGGAPSFGRRKP